MKRDSRASGVNAAPIAISMGDPAGIGSEVILKAAAEIARRRGPTPRLVVIGDLRAMHAAARRLEMPEPVAWSIGDELPSRSGPIAVLSLGRLRAAAYRPGHPSAEGGDAAYRYIVEGARMAMSGAAAALVTAPISKEWMNRAGHNFPGHSELLAKISRTKLWRMMFAGEQLRLALVTVHIGLAKVPRALSVERVQQTITLLAEHLRALGIARPRLGVLGLNPHAGENGMFGSEEPRIIVPAIEGAQKAGIAAFGPLAPDTAFCRVDGAFRFDAAVAMYHDQGLIALKTLEFDRAVNVTLGLPFVRTSPDHGTAFDIAGKNRASATSMIAAIDYAWRATAGYN